MSNFLNFNKDIYHLKRENNIRRKHAVTFSCLGKLDAVDSFGLLNWKLGMGKMLGQALNKKQISSSPLIIGLAESGIIPSALFHQMLMQNKYKAEWICSTRRPAAGIYFKESHSHGPDHVLPLPEKKPSELWFIEDEITTGKTLLHLCLSLCSYMNVYNVRFFAFTDTRSKKHKTQFNNILKSKGLCFLTHILIQSNGKNDAEFKELSLDINENHVVSNGNSKAGWHFPDQRPALKNQSFIKLPLKTRLKGSLLAIGEAIDMGVHLVQTNPGLRLHHITLSPWQIDEVNIFNRIDICNKYYLYNFHNLRSPLYILNDPIDDEIGIEAVNLLKEKGFIVEHLKI